MWCHTIWYIIWAWSRCCSHQNGWRMDGCLSPREWYHGFWHSLISDHILPHTHIRIYCIYIIYIMCTHTHIYICIYIWYMYMVHICIDKYVYIYIYVYIHTHTYIYIYIFEYVRTPRQSNMAVDFFYPFIVAFLALNHPFCGWRFPSGPPCLMTQEGM